MARHDWYYQYGQGQNYYRGHAEQGELKRVAGESPEHRDLFDKVRAWKMNGGEQVARPSATQHEMFESPDCKGASR